VTSDCCKVHHASPWWRPFLKNNATYIFIA
jgi:hypothetical protein